TTLLNVLSSFIPPHERIVTIEDPCELQLRQRHVIRLETRPPNVEGKGQVTQRELLRNALRMRPDRIIIGEVRAGEAFDMLQAMNTGHDGSLTTVHANAPRDALARIENMVLMAGLDLPVRAIREQVASALDLVIHVARLSDGSRRVTHVAEVVGMEGQTITMQDIFVFQQTGVDSRGKVQGRIASAGLRPHFVERFDAAGIGLRPEIFAAGHAWGA
ncbi:MAG: CpaF family protein, partial [Chloroflexi bacterium]|nr:CpaF family protein [Chloroflexota bacterium]